MPWDNHMLQALYAYPPRGLLLIGNTGIDYLGPSSNWHCALASRKVFDALGVKYYLGFSTNSHGSSHCSFPSVQGSDVTTFIDKLLLNKATANTDVFNTDGKFATDEKRWIDWLSPALT
jgi:hypothetical protein